jgi:haloacetate dehalogenase
MRGHRRHRRIDLRRLPGQRRRRPRHDSADQEAGRMLAQPLHVLWGEHGAVGRCFDVPALWRAAARDFSGGSLTCGHYIAEEAPGLLLQESLELLRR